MNGIRSNWTLDRRFPSEHERACKFTDQVLKQLQIEGWSDSDRFAVHMGLEEGLMNAIKHGNQSDPRKSVELQVILSDTEVYIRITDEGCGFIATEVPDPTSLENRRKESGRGVALIRGFMDQVEYNERGNQLEMRKYRTRCD